MAENSDPESDETSTPTTGAPTDAEVAEFHQSEAGHGQAEDTTHIDDAAVTHDPVEAEKKAEESADIQPEPPTELPADATNKEGVKSVPTQDSLERQPFLK